MSSRTLSRSAGAVVAAVLVLLFVAGLGAGSSLPPLVAFPERTVGIPPPSAAESNPYDVDLEDPVESEAELPPLPGVPDWVTDVLWFVALFVVLPTVVWVVARLVQQQLAIRARRAEAPHVAFDEEPLRVDAEEVAGSFAETIFALRRGVDVDAAILACWRRLEDLVAATGTVRRPTQTADEFTVDVLSATRADDAALRRLAALYREAAFSAHALGDEDRDAALDALERLHASLTAATR